MSNFYSMSRRKTWLASVCLVSGLIGSAAAADSAADTADGAKPAKELQEVIVTAEKVRSPLQKTALSATSFGAEVLDRSNITTIADLDGMAPGVTISKNQGFNRIITIRGVGYEANQNDSAQPGVSYNLDGVYIASPLGLLTGFLDVDHIEVLRGPQGTVFGQNSTGGAINVVDRDPSLGVREGKGDVAYGSYNYLQARLSENIPLGEDLATRVAIDYTRHDGWAVATSVPGQPNYPLDNDNTLNTRIQALYRPTESLSIKIWGQYSVSNTNAAAQKSILDPNPNPRQLTQDYPGKFYGQFGIGAIDIKYQQNGLTFRSISSYQNTVINESQDYDKLTPALSLAAYGVTDVVPLINRNPSAFTEEFDVSNNDAGRFRWIAGGFFLSQISHQLFYEYQQTAAQQGLPIPTPRTVDVGEFFDLLGDGLDFQTNSREHRLSVSVYGQGTYDLSSRTRITAGARFTHDRSTAQVQNFFGYNFSGDYSPPVPLATGADSLTGKLTLEHDLTDANMIYVMASTGIKPGGTSLNPTSLVVPSTFKQERVNAAEVGSKNTFFDKAVRLNLSAFFNDYHNFQFHSEDPINYQGGVDNLPHMYTYGLEGEGAVLLPDNFRLDGNFATLGGRIDSNFVALDPVIANQINRIAILQGESIFSGEVIGARYAQSENLNGKTPPKLPGFTTNLALSHTLDMGSAGIFESRIEVEYRTPFWYRVYNNPGVDRVPTSYNIDLDFRYLPADKPWTVEFMVLNLTNRASINSLYSDAFGVGQTSREYTPPRQFILRMAFKL